MPLLDLTKHQPSTREVTHFEIVNVPESGKAVRLEVYTRFVGVKPPVYYRGMSKEVVPTENIEEGIVSGKIKAVPMPRSIDDRHALWMTDSGMVYLADNKNVFSDPLKITVFPGHSVHKMYRPADTRKPSSAAVPS